MSKIANLYLFLSGILGNHSITSLVSFHWLIFRESLSWWFILLRMFLLIWPISLFAGLISLTLRLFLKLGLWSFNIIKHSFLPFVNIRFNISLSFMNFFLSMFILLWILLLAFLYVVIVSFSIFWYCSFFNLYRLHVLSANVNVVSVLWIVFISSFNLFWKWLLLFWNFNDLIISNKLLFNWINYCFCYKRQLKNYSICSFSLIF